MENEVNINELRDILLDAPNETFNDIIDYIHPADILDVLHNSEEEDRLRILQRLPEEIIADIIEEEDDEDKYSLLQEFSDNKQIEILEEMGVDYLFSISFEEIMKLSPQDFVDKVLIERFRIDTAVCGFNFTYGYKAAGTADMLRGMAAGRFDVAVVDPVKVNGQVVSSTLIREKIMNGDVEAVPELLGRNFTIRGTVIHGNEIGRTIGFPTCNIVIDESMAALPNGVYMTYCYVEGVKYCSITNVGNKPTIGEYGKNIETNIFNFNENIYDKKITVEFLKKIRDEQKFDDLEALKKQIHDDSVLVRKEHGL